MPRHGAGDHTPRRALRLIAGLPLPGRAACLRSRATKPLIGRLIAEAQRVHPQISQRIDFISRSLLGVRYQANTLIGGPRSQEVFVVRDDAFDCVTFCEVVLAAALARDLDEFETALLRIRYENGQVKWERPQPLFRRVEPGAPSRTRSAGRWPWSLRSRSTRR